MLTSIDTPIIEAYKLRLNVDPTEVQSFVRRFMDSPEAEPFRENVDGAPGVSVYDSRKPVQGLQSFGFEGAAKLVDLYARSLPQGHKDYELNATFEDGDLLVIQAREELPFSGGSTLLGKLRIALYKSALAEGLVEPDPDHHYLWVTDFPMFTLDNTTDPGQGGTAGFSATHHPFTAPKTAHDVDLLLTDPLKAKADHYDLVVNGVELGGGSRRIHNAAMQQFVMREILKVHSSSIIASTFALLTSSDERRTHERLLPSLRSSPSRLPSPCWSRGWVRPADGSDDWPGIRQGCHCIPKELKGRRYDGQEPFSNHRR